MMDKSFAFAVRIIRLYKLLTEKQVSVMSKHLVPSSTA